ncbi:MFS transporter [Arthrobacter sp. MYb211]|uniref:MFS transporter n=1 Tax=Micrococcaceae TaxID=1268 RepID=UPI000CFA86B2|nr:MULTISPECIES: MFS transporter [unclassified Arthrobacter]PQZ97627.1 MFS transporter [Arthrobacter sp. MYb224]PRA04142.1 MFS transporter [Arthrobacter sp. MYb229]PRA11640.1 MFS transporter [Arthrobacter sp. MYb221]PRB51946.1 MFS transporter [Arthrobacter sp. MYb216]PRC07857.1 MFS transporter [Arthrobacter sp. MYb211]
MPSPRDSAVDSATVESIYAAKYLATTLGMFVLVFLVGFEALAVSTIMPLVSELLDGQKYFALAFAAPIASAMLGMVAAGEVSDRRGPKIPLYASVAIFAGGLLICGTAADMQVLILGRILQGIGGGAVTVAIFVLIARAYPAKLHSKIFALFAAAGVIPALLGPWIAGLIATYLGWRWVFLGVLIFIAFAIVAVIPTLHRMDSARDATLGPVSIKRLLLAGFTGASVIAMNLLGLMDNGWPSVVALLSALALALLAIRPLLPVGTFSARRGMPATVLTRSLVAGAFFGTEVYLPYLLREDYFLPPDRAGLVLTASALSWALGSWLQGKAGERLSNSACIGIGALAGAFAISTALYAALFHPSVAIIVVGWAIGGFGMGMIFPRQNVNMLALSGKQEQGFNSSAMTMADALGNAGVTALGGVIFATVAVGLGFAAVFAFSLFLIIVLLVVTPRIESPAAAGPK